MKISIVLSAIITSITLISCQTGSEKADKLRIENKFDEAADLYQKAANKGDAYAMWRLSCAYSNGDGVEWNERKALEFLEQSAQAGCEEAKCDLALAYIFDWFNIGKDEGKGEHMLEDLVESTKNSTVLSRYAGYLFLNKEDPEKAMRIQKRIEDKNNPHYLYLMGLIYTKGTETIDIDVPKAIEYFTKAFENGRKYSAYIIQEIYKSGYGEIKPNKIKRIEWLNRGIESNVTECMVDMAQLCMSDDSTYQTIHNPQRAIELLKKATRHGSGEAYFIMGNCYYNGKYLPKDDNKAFECWSKSVELKYFEAASNLAYAYIYGVGCAKDVQKGIDQYKLAIKHGSGFSANKLFYIYWAGEYGVEKDMILAKKYLLEAARLGDSHGCFILGKHYYTGEGLMDKNTDQAFVYMKKAADMGHIDACNYLAYFYENGIGVDKNPQKAKEYKDKTIANSDNNKE